MRQFSKIALCLFLLITVTFLLGEMEERTVIRASSCDSGQLEELGHVCHGELCLKPAGQKYGHDLRDDDHHPVKNFFIKSKVLALVEQEFIFAYSFLNNEAPTSDALYTFVGRAPPCI